MVPVRSPLQKATALLAMLRLHPGAPGFQACAWHVFFPFPRTSPAQTECLGSFSPRGLAVWRRPEVKKKCGGDGPTRLWAVYVLAPILWRCCMGSFSKVVLLGNLTRVPSIFPMPRQTQSCEARSPLCTGTRSPFQAEPVHKAGRCATVSPSRMNRCSIFWKRPRSPRRPCFPIEASTWP